MTPMQIKVAAWGGLALLAWLCTKAARARSVTGDVELGVGTVDGIYGNDIYYSPRPSTLPAPTNPVMEAIERSNAALARDRAENPELYE